MKLTYLIIDISKIPEGWEIEKWLHHMKSLKIFTTDILGVKVITLDVTIWEWLKSKLSFKTI